MGKGSCSVGSVPIRCGSVAHRTRDLCVRYRVGYGIILLGTWYGYNILYYSITSERTNPRAGVERAGFGLLYRRGFPAIQGDDKIVSPEFSNV